MYSMSENITKTHRTFIFITNQTASVIKQFHSASSRKRSGVFKHSPYWKMIGWAMRYVRKIKKNQTHTLLLLDGGAVTIPRLWTLECCLLHSLTTLLLIWHWAHTSWNYCAFLCAFPTPQICFLSSVLNTELYMEQTIGKCLCRKDDKLNIIWHTYTHNMKRF